METIVMKGDDYVLMDVNGAVRVPDRLRMNEAEAKELADFIFIKTRKHIGVKRLDLTFQELDNLTGKTKKTHTPRRWTTDEEETLLLHMGEDDKTIGERIGRSNMSVFFHMKNLAQEFDLWKEDEGQAFVQAGESRAQLIKRFLEVDS